MIDWKKNGIQIVTVIISSGLIGTGLISLGSVFNRPHIDIQIKPNEADARSTIISVTNNGNIAASHMILTVQSPQDTLNEKTILNTENATKTKIDSRTSQFYVPRLVQGSGSILMILMQMQEKPKTVYPNYTLYATYDQGSTKFVYQKPLTLVEEFWSLWNAYGLSTGLIIAGVIIGFVYINHYIPLYDFTPLPILISKIRKPKSEEPRYTLDLLRLLIVFREMLRD
ncbi:MAG: hypothetical protein WA667_09800 [Candidatus Nitrosopolaris sp.]